MENIKFFFIKLISFHEFLGMDFKICFCETPKYSFLEKTYLILVLSHDSAPAQKNFKQKYYVLLYDDPVLLDDELDHVEVQTHSISK